MHKYVVRISLLVLLIIQTASAAHIGKVEVKRIRNFSPSYVVVWLDREINNPPACATVLNKIVVTGTDTEWGKQKLSMLMTAMAAGYAVDSNCGNTCKGNWDGQITVCSEVSIEK